MNTRLRLGLGLVVGVVAGSAYAQSSALDWILRPTTSVGVPDICQRDPGRPDCMKDVVVNSPVDSAVHVATVPGWQIHSAATSVGEPHVCQRDPGRPECDGRREPAIAPRAVPRPHVEKNAVGGAAIGSLAGIVYGIASCTPFLWGPPLYGICAAAGALTGMLIGGAAGLVVSAVEENQGARAEAPASSAAPVDDGTLDPL